jgi:hypothetical protein
MRTDRKKCEALSSYYRPTIEIAVCLKVLLACQQLESPVLRVGATRQSIKLYSILFYFEDLG